MSKSDMQSTIPGPDGSETGQIPIREQEFHNDLKQRIDRNDSLATERE